MRKRRSENYANDGQSQENYNYDDKYSVTGESSFSRDLTIPFDQNEVLAERNYGYRGNMYGKDINQSDFESRYETPKQSFRGIGPKNYSKSDESIRIEACEILYHSPDIDATGLSVEVQGGNLTLSGVVEERWVKKLAEQLIEGIYGLKDIRNEIRVEKNDRGLIQNTAKMN